MLRMLWTGMLLCIAAASPLLAQDDTLRAEAAPKLTVHGYVKYLSTSTFAGIPGYPVSTGLIHNRLVLRYTPAPRWTLSLEARNRLFFGEQVKLDSTFAGQIDRYEGLADLSVRWIDAPEGLLHSIVDRAWIGYTHGKWDIRAGRQRINWGVNLAWNPNDLFNALNFLDFDYEERPGSDAIRVQYFPGPLSRVELAVAPGRYDSTTTGALLYRFHAGSYDVQTLAGYYRGDLALGGGWEGNLGQIGFKGEATAFFPIEGISRDSSAALGVSLTADYMFAGGYYLTVAGLYNSEGQAGGAFFGNSLAAQPLSARNLFPAEWAALVQQSWQPHPLVSLSLGLLYAPSYHLSIFIPSVTYSIKENWDLDLIGQSFFADPGTGYGHQASSVFFRLKWSY
ncbi:MAG: hypothetical protein NW241_11870 [Bacteroidia bacterium]|nr:hypothetical protein [Bacteroidia bacterium]